MQSRIERTPPSNRSLDSAQVESLMEGITKPARIASISPNGFPLISSVWLIYEAEVFWCGMWAREKRRIADACRVAAPGTQSQETGLEPSVSQGLSGRTEAFV